MAVGDLAHEPAKGDSRGETGEEEEENGGQALEVGPVREVRHVVRGLIMEWGV